MGQAGGPPGGLWEVSYALFRTHRKAGEPGAQRSSGYLLCVLLPLAQQSGVQRERHITVLRQRRGSWASELDHSPAALPVDRTVGQRAWEQGCPQPQASHEAGVPITPGLRGTRV